MRWKRSLRARSPCALRFPNQNESNRQPCEPTAISPYRAISRFPSRVIFGSIASGPTRIFNLSGGDDNSRTVRAFPPAGCRHRPRRRRAVHRRQRLARAARAARAIDCGNSAARPCGSCRACWRVWLHSELDGDGSLRQRPMQRVIDPLTQMGARIRSQGGNGLAPLTIDSSGLKGIHYPMPIASAPGEVGVVVCRIAGEQHETTLPVEPRVARPSCCAVSVDRSKWCEYFARRRSRSLAEKYASREIFPRRRFLVGAALVPT